MKKAVLVGLGICGLAGLATVAWYVSPVRESFYSDADTIREPAATARLRDVLWQPPVRLADVLNTHADDYEARVSWDGLTLYFVRGKAGENADIFMAGRTPNGWTEPAALTALNGDRDDLGPEPTADGRSLYFYSNRPGGFGGYDIWVSHLGERGWQPPVNAGPAVNSEFNDYGPAVSPDGRLLCFASNRPQPEDGAGPDPDAWPATVREDLYVRDYDLYAAPVDDAGFGPAAALAELNSPGNEGAAAVSPVGDFLYFASDRAGGCGGFDLYRVRRINGGYRQPENLGSAVNTPANELDPGLSMGGFALFFSSDRPSRRINPDKPNDYDLYLTHSREVFADVEEHQRAGIDWGGLWDQIGPNVLWALLALLLLLLLLRLFNEARMRRLSLITRCLLASLVVHALLMLLFNFWQVTATMAGLLGRTERLKVSLASTAGAGDIATQVRGSFTVFEAPPPAETVVERANDTSRPERPDAAAMLAVERVDLGAAVMIPIDGEVRDAATLAADPPPIGAADEPALSAASDAIPVSIATPQEGPRQVVGEQIDPQVPPAQPSPTRSSAMTSTVVVAGTRTAQVSFSPASTAALTDDADAQVWNRLNEVQEATPRRDSQSVNDVTLNEVPAAVPELSVSLPTDRPPPTPHVQEPEARVAAPPVSALQRQSAAGDLITPVAPQTMALAPQATPSPLAAPAPGGAIPVTRPLEDIEDATLIHPAVELPRPVDATLAAASPEPSLTLPREDNLPAPATETDVALPAPSFPALPRAGAASSPLDLPAADFADFAPAALSIEPRAIDIAAVPEITDARPPSTPIAPAPATTRDPVPAAIALPPLPERTERIAENTRSGADETAPLASMPNEWTQPLAPRMPAFQSAAAVAFETPPLRSLEPTATTRPRWTALAPSPAEAAVSTTDAPAARGDSFSAVTPARLAAADVVTPPVTMPDVKLPDEFEPAVNPFEQREAQQRLEVVQRMGGSEDTERAVALALDWLARHQSEDGRWDGDGFDAACGRCGGETTITADIGLTGLALLAFLAADHTHVKDGPYRDNVNRGLLWLIQQQRRNGDLRGTGASNETMYSHAIATIALSEAYAMTGDPRLRDAVARAVEFIDQARNPREGGWRYDPGQPGDTSVLGWQVMALKSAHLAGFEPPYASLNAARQWLDEVSESSSAGLYAYQPGQRPTPSMTAEGMFVQQLLGTDRDQPRMRESANLLMENLPDWSSRPNTYYWYYGTLAMFQHQGPEWTRWNEAMTRELLQHQTRRGPAAGSWDPVGEWADKGGRVYQTALGALMLEVYYRYLPLYRAAEGQPPDDAIGTIRGRVVDRETNRPLAGAAVRLDLPQRPAVTARTDAQGGYAMFAPRVPDHFAVSASMEGFIPRSANVPASQLKGTTLTLDFSLERESADVVAVEDVPDVHHLGNDRFEGRINSQFQKSAEGRVHEAQFVLSDLQVVPYVQGVDIRLMAKGVQCPHVIRINGQALEQRLDQAPQDGSFGEFVAAIDPGWLHQGVNRLEIEAVSCRGDLDDFEFVNVQFRLQR